MTKLILLIIKLISKYCLLSVSRMRLFHTQWRVCYICNKNKKLDFLHGKTLAAMLTTFCKQYLASLINFHVFSPLRFFQEFRSKREMEWWIISRWDRSFSLALGTGGGTSWRSVVVSHESNNNAVRRAYWSMFCIECVGRDAYVVQIRIIRVNSPRSSSSSCTSR